MGSRVRKSSSVFYACDRVQVAVLRTALTKQTSRVDFTINSTNCNPLGEPHPRHDEAQLPNTRDRISGPPFHWLQLSQRSDRLVARGSEIQGTIHEQLAD